MNDDDVVERYGGFGPQGFTTTARISGDGLALADAGLLDATPAIDDHDLPTPLAIEGPFYKASAPLRADLREPGEMGQAVELTGSILTRSRKPVSGAKVELWHANKAGEYDNIGFRYRGHVVTQPDGKYRFVTIKPGAYGDWNLGTGRTVHYHMIVRAPKVWTFTTQLYFPNEADNVRDDYFRKDLLMRVEPAGPGLKAHFDIVIETFRKF